MTTREKQPPKLYLSPIIDRFVRFVEILAVTALMTFFVRPYGMTPQSVVIYLGSALSLTYLLEPIIVRAVGAVKHNDRTVQRLLRVMAVLLTVMLINALMVFVGFAAIVLSLKIFEN